MPNSAYLLVRLLVHELVDKVVADAAVVETQDQVDEKHVANKPEKKKATVVTKPKKRKQVYDKEKKKAYNRKYRAKYQEKIRQKARDRNKTEAWKAYNREYYKKNREKIQTRKKAYSHEYFSRQRDVLWDLRENKTCAHCPHDQVRHLEFDHLDPTKKIALVTRITNIVKLRAEAAKCQLLCIWCHRIKSAAQRPARRVYTKPEPDAEGRVCHGLLCQGQIRANEHFYHRKGKPYGCCKTCKLFCNQQIRIERAAYVRNMKLNVIKQCQTCPRKVEAGFEMCFDFDHIDQSTKKNSISNMLRSGASQKTLDAEIAKCRLLCCYCHKDHTAEQLEYHYSKAKRTRLKETIES